MPPKKEEAKVDPLVEVGFVLLILILLWMLWSTIIAYYFGSLGLLWQKIASSFMQYVYPTAVVLAVVVSVFSLLGIYKNLRRLLEINKEEEKLYGRSKETLDDLVHSPVQNKNERWEQALAHLNSANAGDWRLAIIEADVMLDEMLRAMGYHGDSIGDILKGVDKSDMLTLEAAWEAHKTRNKIVHSGSDYYLTERDAKHVMSLYESVFREFKII